MFLVPSRLTLTAPREHIDKGGQPRLMVACHGALTAAWLQLPPPPVTLARHPGEHLVGLRLGQRALGGQVCAVCQVLGTRLSSLLSEVEV